MAHGQLARQAPREKDTRRGGHTLNVPQFGKQPEDLSARSLADGLECLRTRIEGLGLSAGGKVLADVLSITPVAAKTAQVRFTKRLKKAGEPDRVGKFYATITYDFQPATASAVQLVWENPFGFTVTDYRVTAGSLESQTMEGQQ